MQPGIARPAIRSDPAAGLNGLRNEGVQACCLTRRKCASAGFAPFRLRPPRQRPRPRPSSRATVRALPCPCRRPRLRPPQPIPTATRFPGVPSPAAACGATSMPSSTAPGRGFAAVRAHRHRTVAPSRTKSLGTTASAACANPGKPSRPSPMPGSAVRRNRPNTATGRDTRGKPTRLRTAPQTRPVSGRNLAPRPQPQHIVRCGVKYLALSDDIRDSEGSSDKGNCQRRCPSGIDQ